jgi:exodeoxyribonuclease VII large subunit
MGVEGADEAGASMAVLQDRLDSDDVALVDTLNEEIGTAIEQSPALDHEFVVGDVSDYGVSANGHAHFDLVNNDSSIHCVVFSSRRPRLDIDLEDGQRVAVQAELSYYADQGSVSLLVEAVVTLGEGEYHQTYQENRALLEGDGLLADEAKQSLPELPKRIGVATSADSAAREDVVTSIHDRYPSIEIVVQDSVVQGDDAMLSLMDAISALDGDPAVEVIVVTRGGGATKHLRVFNEPPLCRTIAATDTPIVVGVGHESDRTLADDVADERVMTPTDVGRIVPERTALDEAVDDLEDSLETAYRDHVDTDLDEYQNDLSTAYERTSSELLETLAEDVAEAYETSVRSDLRSSRERLDRAFEQLQQQKRYEREQAQQEAEYERQQRRQRALIVALTIAVVVLVGLLVYTVVL